VIWAYDANAQLDARGHQAGSPDPRDDHERCFDYSRRLLEQVAAVALCEDLRYYMLLRGMNSAELVFDKQMVPSELRLVDPASLVWNEKQPGVYAPVQKPKGCPAGDRPQHPVVLHSRFHQNPTDVYTFSPFVSAINTIAARQEVINELYRIMRVVGYPRLDFEVLEEVLIQNAPVTIRQDAAEDARVRRGRDHQDQHQHPARSAPTRRWSTARAPSRRRSSTRRTPAPGCRSRA
jgi:hypothetical protein